MDRNARIYIAGHRGLVGSAIHRRLQAEGFTNLITRTHAELDLERQVDVDDFFQSERPLYVFLAAAKVGGILANATYPADFIYRNLAIQNHIIHSSWKVGVRRLLFLGSSCIYPRDCTQPMREEFLLGGPLEATNQPYAVAKIAGIIQCDAYNRQYGTHFLAVMPTNLYGPNDNFDLETSHVLPALIRKFHLAKLAAQGKWEAIGKDEARYGRIPDDLRARLTAICHANGGSIPDSWHAYAPWSMPSATVPAVVLWGTGSPCRELLHVDDLADACLFLMSLDEQKFALLCSRWSSPGESPESQTCLDGPHAGRLLSFRGLPLINIGSGEDLTIRELANTVSPLVGYRGQIVWDDTKPDGTPRKLLDVSRLRELGWRPRINLKDGIRAVYEWYSTRLN